jgi:hypothetical protein
MPPKHLEGCADTLTSSLSEHLYALVSSDKQCEPGTALRGVQSQPQG